MMDQRNSGSSNHQGQTRSLFSARKVALMASVVTGLAVYGFRPHPIALISLAAVPTRKWVMLCQPRRSPLALPMWWSG